MSEMTGMAPEEAPQADGLSVYWSGDSGLFGDFTLGPDEVAFAVNKLIKPRSVIPTHANEFATSGGGVNGGTKTQRFIEEIDAAKVIVPLSGVPITCDGSGRCSL